MIISKVFEEFCSRLGHSGCETAVAEAVTVLKNYEEFGSFELLDSRRERERGYRY